MSEIRYGLKLWSTNAALMPMAQESVRNKEFSYVELTPIPGTDVDPFISYDLPYIIHATTERDGMNIGDRKKKALNEKTILECISWANELKAPHIIMHPGYGSFEDAKDFLKSIADKRFLLENMPMKGLNGESMMGFSPEQLTGLSNTTGYCLDFGHAIKAAASMKRPLEDLIEGLLSLNPKMFHVSDGFLSKETDEHLNIGDGEYNFKYITSCIKRSASTKATLETPRKKRSSIEEDKKNLKKIRAIEKNGKTI